MMARMIGGPLLMLGMLLCASPNVFSQGVREGLFFGVGLDGDRLTEQRLMAVRDATGIAPSLVVIFQQWPGPDTPDAGRFPLTSVQAIGQADALACVTWEPMFLVQGGERAIAADAILGGGYDDYLRLWARAARDYGQPVLVRFAHEMNLARYHWGSDAEGYGPESPARYRAMFRYVVERFREEGADNVFFVFCPNSESVPHPQWDGATWNTASAYYPGDDVVDILGVDGYNWGTTQTLAEHGWESRFSSFADIMRPMFDELRGLNAEKPIVVFEMSSVVQGGDKDAWIRAAVEDMMVWGISGFAWFEVDKENDWRLATGVNPDLADWLRERVQRHARTLLE
ncbi:glycoside hydrolase family 26 protein [Thiocapsa rosea]|uniref:Glycosyl hydrolase family 26 n=1 Tax=Thiocapsa rosea TaxID=69360 RepID=A0A495VB58_9GAMM|nr:glycosyl hydrolase [Thiocapsa rosea]RKT46592.1 glycosyl hydrolase family 26 [Thiocapsa rosea]